MSFEKDLQESINRIKIEVMEQREEILRAFIAKYGWQPEEVEQIIDMSDYASGVIRWYIRKKGGKDGNVDGI
jgi:hypothetical protein